MLRLIVTLRVDGRTIIDSIGPEAIVNMIADRFRDKGTYSVRISYP
jgi:hypothetical protein